MRPRSSLIVPLVLLLLLPGALPAAADTPGVAVRIYGPEKLEVSTEGSYNVKITGPTDVKWGFYVNLSGPQKKAATMSSPDGTVDTTSSWVLAENTALAYPEFNFSLTAPDKAGPLTITVTVLAKEGTGALGQWAKEQWSVDVRAKREVTINATVRNSGEVTVDNLLVSFMVKLNGQWVSIGNQTLQTVEPGKKQNVSLLWNSSLVDNGVYTVRIVVDPDHTLAQYSGGEGVMEQKIELRTPGAALPKPVAPGVYVLTGLVAAAAIGGLIYYRKKKIV